MTTIEEAIQEPGIYQWAGGIGMHFNPFPNWYGCILGFDCPLCGESIDWEWVGKLPSFTNPASVEASGIYPQIVNGARLDSWGHRWIRVVCHGCNTPISAENYDIPPEGA